MNSAKAIVISLSMLLLASCAQEVDQHDEHSANALVEIGFTRSQIGTAVGQNAAEGVFNGYVGVLNSDQSWRKNPNNGSATRITCSVESTTSSVATSASISVPEESYRFVSVAVSGNGRLEIADNTVKISGGAQSDDNDVIYAAEDVKVEGKSDQPFAVNFNYRHLLSGIRLELSTPDNESELITNARITGMETMQLMTDTELDIASGELKNSSTPLGTSGEIEFGRNYLIVPGTSSVGTLEITYDGRKYKGQMKAMTFEAGHRTVLRMLLSAAEFTFSAALTDWSTDATLIDSLRPIDQSNIYIPDPVFRRYLIRNFDSDGDNCLSHNEAAAITRIVVPDMGIRYLIGIEYCTALEHLDAARNDIQMLDLSLNTKLRYLNCSNNRSMSRLNVSGCTLIEELYALNCNYSQLDLQSMSRLTRLDCSANPVTEIDLMGKSALTWIDCSLSRLSRVDISNCTKLNRIDCSESQLSQLVLGRHDMLSVIRCQQNIITRLDLSGCAMLDTLVCNDNRLDEIVGISAATRLKSLNADHNSLTRLDMSANTSLQQLSVANNLLSTLNLGSCAYLTELICNSNRLSQLDIDQCQRLAVLTCNDNLLTELYVNRCQSLTALDCSPNATLATLYLNYGQSIAGITSDRNDELIPAATRIEYLGHATIPDANFKAYLVARYDKNQSGEIEHEEGYAIEEIDVCTDDIYTIEGIGCFPNLKRLVCYGRYDPITEIPGEVTIITEATGKLTSVDLSLNTQLRTLKLFRNRLSQLDLSHNPLLDTLDLNYNEYIEQLDISNLNRLVYINCSSAKLTTLDFSANPLLTDIICKRNKLTQLNVAACTQLRNLNCAANLLPSIDISKNQLLETIDCNTNRLSSLSVRANTKLVQLNCSANDLAELDIATNTALVRLECSQNMLRRLDVSNNPKLAYLTCVSNPYLTELILLNGQTIDETYKDSQTKLTYK